MENPWSIPAMGWTVTVVGWLLSPIISLVVNKLVARLIFDSSKELRVLEVNTVPDLLATLRVVEEKRMMGEATDEVPRSDLGRLGNMYLDLKSALCDAEDILDLVDYRRIEKKVTGEYGGSSCGVQQQLLHAAGSSIVALWTGSWVQLQRCIDITPAPLLQFVQRMKLKLGQLSGGIISLWRSSGANILPVSQETSTAGVQRIFGRCRHLVTNITIYCRAVLSWSTHRIADARYYRDWSYEQIGIRSNQQKDGNPPITESIRLKKQINDIEVILNSSKKSDLLNKNSSSTAKNDSDKESSSNRCIDKSSAKESSSKQKEIDNLYGSIEQEVFGRDKDRQDISMKLRERPGTNAASSSNSKPYSVIGIYGITGSGKTTLAELVCKYERGEAHFNLIMFIRVGKTFSLGDIFCDMLEQIKQQQASDTKDPGSLKTELKDLKSLKAELEKELHNKCFLLVLDDLWVNGNNKKEREILLDVLDAGKSGSRILVTAQRKDAAAALGAQEKMQIPIPDIEEEQYLSMFMHYALEASQVTNTDYDRYTEIGRKITKKLHRSPIAARTVAAQLQSNINIDFWETTANLDVLNETVGALWWSYQQLGDDIKRCFTYCSMFPKGYGLKRDELVRIWIAQGFVKSRSNATEELEALGQSYFNQLLTFSFMQVRQRTGRFGQEIVEFTIHDLLHELAERVSGSEFWSIDLKNESTKDTPPGVHHLFIKTNNLAEIIEKILDMRNLRTLIIKVKDPFENFFEAKERYGDKVMETIEKIRDLEEILERLFVRLTKLRTLIIDQFRLGLSVPASIDQMKHLRYLGFVCPAVARLTLRSTFSKLYHMQIIDIPCLVASGPEDMANLIYLRHISAPLSFPNIRRLTSLQTLREFVRKEEQGYGLKQLMHLNQLRGTLRIEGLGIVRSKEEALDAHLVHKEGIRELELRFDGCKGAQLRKVAEVLEGLCPPKDTQVLSIKDYRGSRYPSWMLSRHHPDAPKQLHRLVLRSCSQLASIPEGSELFIALRELRIYYCDWDILPENIERLLSLKTLQIWSCKKMEGLPTLPQALEMIDIRECDMLRSIGNMDCPRLEVIWEKEKRLESSLSPHPMIPCPCLVNLRISRCDNLVTLTNLPPSLKTLLISKCEELCSVSGQLGQLEYLFIDKCNKLQSVDSLGDASSLETLVLSGCQWLVSLGSSGGPGTFISEREKHLQTCTSLEYCQDNGPTGTPEQSPYPVIPCPCLVTLEIGGCDNLVTLPNLPPSLVNLEIQNCANLVALPNLPPSLKDLLINKCEELCSVSGQLGQLERLHIYNCNKLQSVNSLEEGSSLERLLLSCCQCLASLGSSGGPGSYLALRRLEIKYCPAMDMKQFSENVLDVLIQKEISHALSSNPDENERMVPC